MLDNMALCLSVGSNVMNSVIVIFLLMSIGFFLAKKDIIKKDGIKQMTEMVLLIVVPCVIINAYQRDFNIEQAKNLLLAMAFAIIFHFICILIAPLIFRKKDDPQNCVKVFGTIYSNCGFMALPLIQSLYGADGVFYAVAYLTVFNILYFTHGVYIYTNDIKQLSFVKTLTTPGIVGTLIGLLLFLLRIRLPKTIAETVSFISAINTPLPMFILGTYLVDLNIKKIIKNKAIWSVCGLKLIAAPILGIILAKIMGLDAAISMPLIVSCCCPVAAVVALFAVRYNRDSILGSELVSVSTLFSIITIPVMMVLATLVLM